MRSVAVVLTIVAMAPAAGGADGAGAGVGTIDGAPGVTVNPTTSFSTVNTLSGGTSPDGGTGGTVTNFAVESTLAVTSASVLESGLPDGSSSDAGTRAATGSFTITDPNGLTDIDLIQIGPGVFERGDEFLSDLSELEGASVDVGFGIVTLTDFTATDPNTGTFTFSYELDETVDNDSVAGATETEFEESFDIVVRDGNSLSATGTVSVNIVDDGPSAQVMSQISNERSFSASDLTLNGDQPIEFNGFTISAGTFSGDVPSGDPVGLPSLTNEQSGIGIAGGSNEIDVTEQEYIQIDFGEDVSRASIELGSLGGHYNAGANPDAQINVLLFKDGDQVPGNVTYEFDTDDGSLVISGGKATLELENQSEFDSIRVFTTQGDPGGLESTNSNFVLLGASINKAFTLSAGDNDGVAELTETSLGYGVKGGSNEVDVTNGEFIQVDFAASVIRVDLELDSLAGNYNVNANANAEIRVVLFKDGTEVDTLIFDPDEENGALLDISNRKATITIEELGGFDLLKIYTDDGTDNRTPVNSNFTLKNVEILEHQDFAIPKTLIIDESPLPDGGDGVDSITEDFSTFFKAVTDED